MFTVNCQEVCLVRRVNLSLNLNALLPFLFFCKLESRWRASCDMRHWYETLVTRGGPRSTSESGFELFVSLLEILSRVQSGSGFFFSSLSPPFSFGPDPTRQFRHLGTSMPDRGGITGTDGPRDVFFGGMFTPCGICRSLPDTGGNGQLLVNNYTTTPPSFFSSCF